VIEKNKHSNPGTGAGRSGAIASASEILGVGQSSNVTAISGKHYFRQFVLF